MDIKDEDWKPISSVPEGIDVWKKIHEHAGARNQQIMKKSGNLWFAGSVYVYYQPTHWAPVK